MKYRIIIADPSPIVLEGLCAMLQNMPEYEVVLKTDYAKTILTRVHAIAPDILIINPVMLDYNKIGNVRSIFEELPDMKIVALVYAFFESLHLKQFNGIIEITDDVKHLRTKLNDVIEASRPENEDNDPSQLSEREREILINLVKGRKSTEIAELLNISVHTVLTHRKNIMKKTGIKSISALTVYAILNNLIEENDII